LSLNNFNGLKQTKSIKSGSSNELWFMNNTILILAWLFFWPIGLYGSIKRNKYKKSLTQ